MTNDSYIRERYITKSGHFNSNWHRMLTDEEKEYVDMRYSDSESTLESLMRICKHIDVCPTCPVCNYKKCKFTGDYRSLYSKTCSRHCAAILGGRQSRIGERAKEIKSAIQSRYGVDNVFQLDNVKHKIKITKATNHKDEKWNNRRQARETTILRYGGRSYFADKSKATESIYKKISTVKSKYGVDNVFKSNVVKSKIRDSLKAKYGVDNPARIESLKLARKQHEYETKLKNGTFNTSSDEEKIYLVLCENFPEVKRQFSSVLYPHHADFYIPSLDLYIEYNGHWTHGGKLFDPNSSDDLNKIKRWKAKNSPYYNNAIKTWMVYDRQKYLDFMQNNLHFKIFWNMGEFDRWIDKIKKEKA